MFRKLRTRIGCAFFLFAFVFIGTGSAQEEERAAKKSQTIDVQIQVTDKDGTPIDNVQILVKWGEGETDSEKAVTNKSGVARIKDVPQETVTIRLIANGYKRIAPSFNLKTEKLPIKLSLDKESPHLSQ